MSTALPVAGIPGKSPVCVPLKCDSMHTLAPSEKIFVAVHWKSGKAAKAAAANSRNAA